MSNNTPENKFDFDSLFKEVQTVSEIELTLPSLNKAYKAHKLLLRPMTFEDEKNMVVAKKNNQDVINDLLQRCVTNYDAKEILVLDKLYILMKLREISYREEYPIVLGCQSCNKENNLVFKLSDLKINYVPDDFSELKEIELPKTKVKVKIKLPRVVDEIYFKNETLLAENIWRFIKSVNGSDDITIISKFVKDPRLPLPDLHILMQSIFKSDYGVDTTIKFTCDSCSYVNIDSLPMTSNFFTMN